MWLCVQWWLLFIRGFVSVFVCAYCVCLHASVCALLANMCGHAVHACLTAWPACLPVCLPASLPVECVCMFVCACMHVCAHVHTCMHHAYIRGYLCRRRR